MNTALTPDDLLDRNLRAVGGGMTTPAGPTPELLACCMDALDAPQAAHWRSTVMKFRKPLFFSTVGLAAALALFVGVLSPHSEPRVHAALIADTLARQAQEAGVLDITIENLAIEGFECDAHLQVGKSGLAGDVRVTMNDMEDGVPTALDVDAALGLGAERGWVLLRKLSLPDAGAQAFVNMLFPPSSEMLLVLPADAKVGAEIGINLQEKLAEFQSGEILQAVKDLIVSHAELGATLRQQADGTVLLTLPIPDEDALEAIIRVVHKERAEDAEAVGADETTAAPADTSHRHAHHEQVKSKVHAKLKKSVHAKAGDDDNPLVGATLSVLYDPAGERVQRIDIAGLGEKNGHIAIALRGGDLDASLLDSTRVAKPGTRTLDLSAIESIVHMFEGLEKSE